MGPQNFSYMEFLFREVKEAQKIVGRFLRDEAGSAWLSGLVKTGSAPLRTEDLMTAILQEQKPEGELWKAAKTLSEASKLKTLSGVKLDPVMGQTENWKDLIESIENEDDIICLYRKNTEETAKKAEDWQSFLKTFTPGYTVHLAIDTGVKYVICLKKIEVPEITSEDTLTSPEVSTHTITREVTSETTKSIPVTEKLSTASTPVMKLSQRIKLNEIPDHSDESCSHSSTEDDEYQNKLEDEKLMQGTEDDSSSELDYSVNSGLESQMPTSGPMGAQSYRRSQGETRLNVPRIPEENYPSTTSDPQCRRPIIFVVQNGNRLQRYQPRLPIRQMKFPGVASMNAPVIQKPVNFHKILRPIHGTHWHATRAPILQNSPLPYKILNRKSQSLNDHRKPVIHNTRNASGSKFGQYRPNLDTTSSRHFMVVSDQRKLHPFASVTPVNRLPNIRYPQLPNSKLRTFNRQTTPEVNQILGRAASNPTIVKDQSRMNFLQQLQQQRNAHLTRQYLQSRYSRLTPQTGIPGVASIPITRMPIRPAQTFVNFRPQPRQVPLVNPSLPENPQKYVRNINWIPFFNNLQSRQNIQAPCRTLNPLTILPANNFLPSFQNQMPLHSSIINHPVDSSVSTLNQLQSSPCPSPCDRPIKLQIIVQGKIQEPLDVAVVNVPEQNVEIVGSENPIMPLETRMLAGESPGVDPLSNADENIQPEIVEIGQRIKGDEETKNTNWDDSSVESTSLKDDVENPTITEATMSLYVTDSNENMEIQERFLVESTINPTVATIENSTMFEANSTIIL